MHLRFYLDPDTDLPHIYGHGVTETEVSEVLRKPIEEIRGRSNSVVAIGQTKAGRYLRVIYSPDAEGEGIFVITAYDLTSKQLKAVRRRRRT